MIQARINAGLARARAESVEDRKKRVKAGELKHAGFGRPKTDKEDAVREALSAGDKKGILKIAKECGVGSGTVQRIKKEMAQPAA